MADPESNPALASTVASGDETLGLAATSADPSGTLLVPVEEVAAGTLFGNFEVVRKIGHGGMGMVYEAKHRAIGRQAAIKVMHRACAQHPDYAVRFLNGIR